MTSVPVAGRRRRALRSIAAAIGLASLAALVFGAALAVTMPASVLGSLVTLPSQVETLSGSAWRGRARLAGGHDLAWTASPRDLWRAGLALDATLEGPGTALAGRIAVSPWHVAALGWEGRAGPGLLALAPRLVVATCAQTAVVAVERLSLGRRSAAAEGGASLPAGACTLDDGTVIDVPALDLALATEGRDARATLSDGGGALLVAVTVSGERRLLLRVEPEGAALVPGMPSSAPTILEMPF